MAQNMGMTQGQEQTLNPKMIAFYELLQQPNVNLDQAINFELEENPALDISAERTCPACGAFMPAAVCRECGYKLTREDEEESETEQERDQIWTFPSKPRRWKSRPIPATTTAST